MKNKIITVLLITTCITLSIFSYKTSREKSFLISQYDFKKTKNDNLKSKYDLYVQNKINYKEIDKKTKFVYNQNSVFQMIKRYASINDCTLSGIFEEYNQDQIKNEYINLFKIKINLESQYENEVIDFIRDINNIFLMKIENMEINKTDDKINSSILIKLFFLKE